VSTPADHLIATEAGAERRFYPRILPYALISVDFAEDNPGMLLNVSENGLLVSTPVALAQNYVSRVALPLNGLARPIEVFARVVWTAESNRAGLQLLDLSEHDRERIRKWAALEGSRGQAAEACGVAQSEAATQETASEAAPAEDVRGVGEAEKVAPKTKRARGILAAGVPAVLLVGLGLAVTLRGSPLHGWLARSFQAGLRAVVALPAKTAAKASMEQQRADVAVAGVSAVKMELPSAPPATKSAATGVPPTEKAGEPKGGSKQIKTAAKGQVRGEGESTAAPPAQSGVSATKREEDEKSREVAPSATAPEKSVEVTPREPETAQPPKAESKDDAPSPETPAAEPPVLENRNGVAPRTDAPPMDTDAAKEPNPVNPRANGVGPAVVAAPAVVVTQAPQSRVLTVTVSNQSKPSLLRLPGERVVEGASATLRVQRSIVVPAARNWWNGERKEKAVLGDLVSRIDPQPPRALPGADTQVTVRALVGKDGQVERLVPVNGPVALVSSAGRAVRQWRFQPTYLDGKAVETEAYVVIEFRASGGAAQP